MFVSFFFSCLFFFFFFTDFHFAGQYYSSESSELPHHPQHGRRWVPAYHRWSCTQGIRRWALRVHQHLLARHFAVCYNVCTKVYVVNSTLLPRPILQFIPTSIEKLSNKAEMEKNFYFNSFVQNSCFLMCYEHHKLRCLSVAQEKKHDWVTESCIVTTCK